MIIETIKRVRGRLTLQVLAGFMLLIAIISPFSQADDASPLPTLLIIGTAHFDSPGRDEINFEVEDIMTSQRQQQMTEFVAMLESEYAPTHIAVEFPATAQEQIDEAYRRYLNDNLALRRGEQHQLGYRLGKRAELDKIYGVDWNNNPPGDISNYDWPSFAQAHGMQDAVDRITDPADKPNVNDMSEQTITEWLININSPRILAEFHQVYFDIAQVRADGFHPGANWVGSWYARNLKILNNILSVSPELDARIVVFYGIGHAYLLNQLAEESGKFNVVTLPEVLQ